MSTLILGKQKITVASNLISSKYIEYSLRRTFTGLSEDGPGACFNSLCFFGGINPSQPRSKRYKERPSYLPFTESHSTFTPEPKNTIAMPLTPETRVSRIVIV